MHVPVTQVQLKETGTVVAHYQGWIQVRAQGWIQGSLKGLALQHCGTPTDTQNESMHACVCVCGRKGLCLEKTRQICNFFLHCMPLLWLLSVLYSLWVCEAHAMPSHMQIKQCWHSNLESIVAKPWRVRPLMKCSRLRVGPSSRAIHLNPPVYSLGAAVQGLRLSGVSVMQG